MNWGNPFRDAWQRSTDAGRAAAGKGGTGLEQGAGLLANPGGPCVQRGLYAAQDRPRIAWSASAGAQAAPPDTAGLRRAMEDLRQGRITPEKAETHLQQTVRAALAQAQSAPPPPAVGPAVSPAVGPDANEESRKAMLRFGDMRNQLAEQFSVFHQQLMQTSSATLGNERNGALRPNLELVDSVVRALAHIDRLFLEHKAADDPAVPLPQDSHVK